MVAHISKMLWEMASDNYHEGKETVKLSATNNTNIDYPSKKHTYMREALKFEQHVCNQSLLNFGTIT
jgi:hypothetical protein